MAAREINTQRSIKTAIIRAPCLPELEGVDSLLLLHSKLTKVVTTLVTNVRVG